MMAALRFLLKYAFIVDCKINANNYSHIYMHISYFIAQFFFFLSLPSFGSFITASPFLVALQDRPAIIYPILHLRAY